MMSAWDCLHFATLELVRSTPIKQRLVEAYRRHLAALPEDQLPKEAREAFARLRRVLGEVQPRRGEDAVTASVRKMSIQDADDCASCIVEIFGAVCRFNQSTIRGGAVVPLHRESAAAAYELTDLIVNR